MTPAAPGMGHRQARALVEARLSRAPRDPIEAAVVLEAWGGLRSQTAFGLAAQITGPNPRLPSAERDTGDRPQRAPLAPHVALLVTVLTTAAWLPSVVEEYGASLAKRAWLFAVPMAFACQWLVTSRYLIGGPAGARLRRDAPWLGGTLFSASTLSWFVSPTAGLAGALVAAWTCGTVLGEERRTVGYAVVSTAGALLLIAGAPPGVTIAGTAAGVLSLTGWLVLRRPEGEQLLPAPWKRALPAAVVGGLLGGLVLAAGRVAAPSDLAWMVWMSPSVAGNVAAGVVLRRLWTSEADPRALLGRAGTRYFAVSVVLGALLVLGDTLTEPFSAAVELAGIFVVIGASATLISFLVTVGNPASGALATGAGLGLATLASGTIGVLAAAGVTLSVALAFTIHALESLDARLAVG